MAFLSRRQFLTTLTGVSASGLFAGRCHGFPAESPASPAAEPPQPDCQRWMWIELIGFDNQKANLGVADFLDNAGLVPDGLSFLFATADFVHTHRGLDQEVVFPPDYCSYGGKPYNMERKRQVWTNWQLKGLVDGLRKGGVQVSPAYCRPKRREAPAAAIDRRGRRRSRSPRAQPRFSGR